MIEFKYAKGFVDEEVYQRVIDEARTYVAKAEQDDFGGWVNLPIDYDKEEFARINKPGFGLLGLYRYRRQLSGASGSN